MLSYFSQKSETFQGIVLAIAIYLGLSLGDAFLKRVTLEHEIVYTGFIINIATICCLFVAALLSKNLHSIHHTYNLKLHLFRAILFLGVYLTFMYTISNLPIAQTYTFVLTQPFILAILAHLIMKEHIGIHRILAIFGGFIGVLIVLRPGIIEFDVTVIVAIICAFLFASQNILTKCMDPRDNWMSFVFYVMLVQTPILGGYLFFTGSFDTPFPTLQTWGWVFLSGAAYTFGLGAIPIALRKIDAAVFGGLEFSILIWGTLLGYIMFAEIPDQWTIAGALVIVASGVYLVYRERQAHFKLN